MKPLLLLLAGLNLLAAASSLTAEALPPERGWGFEDRGGELALRLNGQQVAEFVYRDAKILRPWQFCRAKARGSPGLLTAAHSTSHKSDIESGSCVV
jgi:hypothetical protein